MKFELFGPRTRTILWTVLSHCVDGMFFILEISEAYLRRKDDSHLKYISNAQNDIDRKQNEV